MSTRLDQEQLGAEARAGVGKLGQGRAAGMARRVLSPDEAERLASRFRAGWEEDQSTVDPRAAPGNGQAECAGNGARLDALPSVIIAPEALIPERAFVQQMVHASAKLPTTLSTEPPPQLRANKSSAPFVVGGIAALVVVATAVALVATRTPAGRDEARGASDSRVRAHMPDDKAVVVRPELVVPPATAAATPTAVASPAPELVRLRARTVPEDAELTLDGASVANPFEAEVARSGEHVLAASARGHEPASLTVELDRDRSVVVGLRRVAQVQPAARPAARPRARGREQRSAGSGFVTENPY